MRVIKRDGSTESFDIDKIDKLTAFATRNLDVDTGKLRRETKLMIYDGITTDEIFRSQVKAATSLISMEAPNFTYVAARFVLSDLYKRVSGEPNYTNLGSFIRRTTAEGLLAPSMVTLFDLDALDKVLDPNRDLQFKYEGISAIIDRYLLKTKDGELLELPQQMFMRVAMGLSLEEDNPTSRAIEFYDLLSSFEGMTSTPTLFNAGLIRSQLSSCFLNIVGDQISVEDLETDNRYNSIFGTIEESARLSKYAGGIGTSWSLVRGAGSHIKGTNGVSSGAIPYMKIWNNTAVAVNQGGKRKGSFSPYLEVWHPDFMEFCELKKEFGEDRLRCKDVYPAAWICDLFMRRKDTNELWSFFCPHKYPELHDLYGEAFNARYLELEATNSYEHQVPAKDVWRKILTNLYETGHPWITFKDTCNNRNPQAHVGTIHSSNLCTEITLNTSPSETAVCNLASVNLSKFVKNGIFQYREMQRAVKTLMRMLDNVIDINYYPSERAKASNMLHRPVGLGMMGYTEALVAMGIKWDSDEHLDVADRITEAWSYAAIEASADLALERGSYPTFAGSTWSKGVLPIDTASELSFLSKELRYDWAALSEKVKLGMRNSNCMAIAPTATISTITGTTPCIEPSFKLVNVESNLSGDFKTIDPTVFYNRPELLTTVWDVPALRVLQAAAVRQKWIDQSQSVNIFISKDIKGKELGIIYNMAWILGLKTTYYLRSLSRVVKDSKLDAAVTVVRQSDDIELGVQQCFIDDPDCESCQ